MRVCIAKFITILHITKFIITNDRYNRYQISNMYCKATITYPISSCRQQNNSGIWESSSPKTSSGKNKKKKATKRPREYSGALSAVSGRETKN